MTYNYYKAMKNDIEQWIEDNINIDDYENMEELEEYLNDRLWIEDSITGNASGSYTFNSHEAMEYVVENMDLLREVCNEFGEAEQLAELFINEEWETMDVTIRCYLLGQMISEVLGEV